MVKIRWTELASNDLDAIRIYISRDSKRYAIRLVKSIIYATENLESMPFLGRTVPEFGIYELREIIHNNFRIIYLVKSNKNIDILAVMHGTQEIRDLISKRL